MGGYLKLTKGRVAILVGVVWVVCFTALFCQQDSYVPIDVRLSYGLALGCSTYLTVLILVLGWIDFGD